MPKSKNLGPFFVCNLHINVCYNTVIGCANTLPPNITFLEEKKMPTNILTQDQLKKALKYERDTGNFVRLDGPGPGKTGTIAGTPHSGGYITICVNRKSYYAHRLAWFYVYGEWPKDQIDHINHVRTDNRIDNLRVANNQENHKNTSRRSDNKSGVTGVTWCKRSNRWRASVSLNNKTVSSFYTSDIFEAICFRKSANNKLGFHKNHGF